LKLETEFVRLPYRFDAERLRAELDALGDSGWRPHPQGHKGNWSIPLVAVGGDPANDDTRGEMLPTPALERCPYFRQVMATLGAPVGRSRLMLIEGEGEALSHVDTHYYWAQRVRVHVPIRTNSRVEFLCGGRSVHMNAGEAWIFDNWQSHNVLNPAADRRVHLVIDTVGSPRFHADVARGWWPFGGRSESSVEPKLVPFAEGVACGLDIERVNHPVVMSPWEMQSLAAIIFEGLEGAADASVRERLREAIDEFIGDWRAIWAVDGEKPSGWPKYRALLDRFDAALGAVAGGIRLDNGCLADEIVRQFLVRPSLNPDLATSAEPNIAAVPVKRSATAKSEAVFDRPVFVVCPPRSGSSLLFETLAQSPSLWTIGGESHVVIERIDGLHPSRRGWDSNRLTAADATHAIVRQLVNSFRSSVVDRDGNPPRVEQVGLRLLEKTPKNALRVPFLAAAFPDAKFIYLYRDPRETLSSMLDAWRSGRFVMYPDLPEWKGSPWSLLLVPGWRELSGKALVEVVAHQWKTTVETLLDDLEALAPDRWCVTSYDRLVASPQEEIERLAEFVDARWDRVLTSPLPESRHTLTSPDPHKWKRNATELAEIMPLVSDVAERAREIFGNPPVRRPAAWQAGKPSPAGAAADPSPKEHPLRSVSTPSVAELLAQGEFSFLVSTYQSGKLITVRASGGKLDTHFSSFPSPMGIAVGAKQLSLGTETGVWHYRNQPGVGPKIDPRADACFLPVRAHYTGDIRVHEMAWAAEELWVVNTRFSTLCTLDDEHSFVPRWRPRFISGLAPEDRCHLNGIAVIDGRIRYVTALGETDVEGGWRENKGTGGILIDFDSGEIVARGLSMPHSPRFYRDRLWILESGKGEFGYLDLGTGRVETVAQLPGFTRGLAFAGPFALIGLSQVRESVFTGLPLMARLKERACGVWVVDIRNGRTVGMLRFEDLVQEIFDVQILPGLRFPEMVEPASPWVKRSFVLPDEALRDTLTNAN